MTTWPAKRCWQQKLIQLKHAAGRPKDLEVIDELQALREERRKLEGF